MTDLVDAIFAEWPGATIINHGVRFMIDKTDAEQSAIERAVPVVGRFIDSLGTTDLAVLSLEQFQELIEVAWTACMDGLLRVPMV